jgi:uncharacterized protein (TIGR03067 family)
MREAWTCSVLLATVAGLAVLRPVPTAAGDDTVKRELGVLQGRWECYGVISFGPDSQETDNLLYGGRKLERGVGLSVMALEVTGDTFAFAGTPTGKATAKLDPTTTPKAIDLTDAKGRTWIGAYELKDDTLTINLSMGKKRPTKITDVGVFGQANAVYKRAKKK